MDNTASSSKKAAHSCSADPIEIDPLMLCSLSIYLWNLYSAPSR